MDEPNFLLYGNRSEHHNTELKTRRDIVEQNEQHETH
jgi:hypothetical protein